MTAITPPSRLRQFWRDRVLTLLLAQFTQGFTVPKISLTMALGVALGVFPILGATTALCAVAGFALKLNQPVLQLVNWLVAPLQLALILVFVRLGEHIVRAPPVAFSIPELFREFHESPARFFRDFGLTGWHGILAWLVIAPWLAGLIYFLLLPPLKKLATAKTPHAD